MNRSTSTILKLIACAAFSCFFDYSAQAANSFTVNLDPSNPGRTIPIEYNGLSVEMSDVCSATPDTSGTADGMVNSNWNHGCANDKNVPGPNEGILGVGSDNPLTSASAQIFQNNFAKLIKRLGIKNIRVGGSSADDVSKWTYPPLQTAKNIIDFAKKIGLTELEWNLPIRYIDIKTYATYAVALLQYKESVYPSLKLIFEIGNEDNNASWSYADWSNGFGSYISAIYAATPSSLQSKLFFTGPSTSAQQWDSKIVADPLFTTDRISGNTVTGAKSKVVYVNTHNYPFQGGGPWGYGALSPCPEAITPAATAAATAAKVTAVTCTDLVKNLLSSGAGDPYNFIADMAKAGLPSRLMETNSMWGGGIEGAGDSYAAALWALNYESWLAQNTNVAGVNLQLGATNGGYSEITPPFTTGTGVNASPTLKATGYAMLAFSQFNQGGKIINPTIVGSHPRVDIYGSLQPNGHLRLLMINKNWTSNGDNSAGGSNGAIAKVAVPKAYTYATTMTLQQKSNDPTALNGISFGGSEVATDGSWNAIWSIPVSPNKDGTFTIAVPPVQAVLVDFSNFDLQAATELLKTIPTK
uniref:hypothetical protein n=1 Tax=Burkholderia arboris TaxID=488730 RepID=UPI003BEF4438